jgi:hypothetical protein
LFERRREQYIEGKRNLKTFKEISLPAASMAYHERLAPSFRQRPWTSEVLRDPNLLELIGKLGYRDIQNKLMYDIFSIN